MRRKSPSRTERGFSLLEMMIAIGVLGIGSLAWMSLQHSAFMGQKTFQTQDDARTLTDDMTMLLSDPKACMASFGGKNPVSGDNSTPAMKDAKGKDYYAVGSIYGNRTLKLNAILLGGSGPDTRSNIQKWVAKTPTSGIALVTVNWKRTGTPGNQGPGPGDLYRFLLIKVTLDSAQKITSCVILGGNTNVTLNNGAGIPNRVPIWTGASQLGSSIITQNGSNIGLGTATPASTLDVLGNIAVGSYAGSVAAPSNGLIVSGNVGIGIPNPSSALEVYGSLRLEGAGAAAVTLRAPTGTPPVTWTLPSQDGSASQVLTTDGAGNLSWNTLCPGTTISGCVVTAGVTGSTSGTCAVGYTGSCSYNCQSSASWTMSDNSCACTSSACAPPVTCPAQEINNCSLAKSDSGQTSGSCRSSYTGSCNFTCNNGTWVRNSDTCCSASEVAHDGKCYYASLSTSPPVSCDAICAWNGQVCDNAATTTVNSNQATCTAVGNKVQKKLGRSGITTWAPWIFGWNSSGAQTCTPWQDAAYSTGDHVGWGGTDAPTTCGGGAARTDFFGTHYFITCGCGY